MSTMELNIGTLRSSMQLTLHTHHASRLWLGRARSEQQAGIIGLNSFLAITNKIMRGSAQDDPYSDYWMLHLEEKIEDVKEQLALLQEYLKAAFSGVPDNLTVSENLNVQPAHITIFASSPLGYMAIYLLAEYDELVRKIILAHHTALIDRMTMEQWLNHGGHQLRSLFTLAQRYHYSGLTRDDFAANHDAARNIIEKLGELPADILDGTRRSRFAPPIIRRSEFDYLVTTDPLDDPGEQPNEQQDTAEAGENA